MLESCFARTYTHVDRLPDDRRNHGQPISYILSHVICVQVLDIAASANLGLDLIRMNRLDTVTTGAHTCHVHVVFTTVFSSSPSRFNHTQPPSGLVTLAKTPKGASIFWEELRRDRVGKKYRALVCDKPPPIGPLHHFMPGKIIHRRPAPRGEKWNGSMMDVLTDPIFDHFVTPPSHLPLKRSPHRSRRPHTAGGVEGVRVAGHFQLGPVATALDRPGHAGAGKGVCLCASVGLWTIGTVHA